MKAEVTTALEYGTDRPCQIGRITYRLGLHDYVALTFRHIDVPAPAPWSMTWVGIEGCDAVRLPDGVVPAPEMLAALSEAMA